MGLGFSSPGSARGQLNMPFGIRFSGVGMDEWELAVADSSNKRVSLFRIADGAFARHVHEGLDVSPYDVEECKYGWLMAGFDSTGSSDNHSVAVLSRHGDTITKKTYPGVGGFARPCALALVPGLGLVVREVGASRRQSLTIVGDCEDEGT